VIGQISKMTFNTFESKAVFIRDRLRGSHPKDHFWVGICKVDSFFRVCSIELNDYLFLEFEGYEYRIFLVTPPEDLKKIEDNNSK
jgi:hypothetical protein